VRGWAWYRFELQRAAREERKRWIEISREVPSDRVLTETDNPGGPKGLIGSIGMPSLLIEVIQGYRDCRADGAEQSCAAF